MVSRVQVGRFVNLNRKIHIRQNGILPGVITELQFHFQNTCSFSFLGEKMRLL